MNELSYFQQASLKARLVKETIVISTLSQLKKSMLDANSEMKQYATNLVFGDGEVNPKIMFIGEGPGEEEDQQALPFVGRSGKLLRNIIHFMNITHYITNVVPYRPPNNRNPTSHEIEFWKPYLEKHIELVNPQYIVLVGRVAAHALLDTKGSMSSLRLKEYNIYSRKTFVFYHPSYLIRFPIEKKHAYEDVKFVLKNAS